MLPCRVCSVRQTARDLTWAICPHRLLAFGPKGISRSQQQLASRVLALAGFMPGELVDVWSEITLKETSGQGAKFDYRLDYVLRSADAQSPPIIVEVMTCSTSGGNRAEQTDMQSAFRSAVLFANGILDEPVRSPSVNIRQVWARMASQMIAKSEAALSWGGRTIWVVQDALANYIRAQTALPLDRLRSPKWKPGEVNLVVSDLTKATDLYSGPIRPTKGKGPYWLEILGAPHIPSLESLTSKLDGVAPIATIEVPKPGRIQRRKRG